MYRLSAQVHMDTEVDDICKLEPLGSSPFPNAPTKFRIVEHRSEVDARYEVTTSNFNKRTTTHSTIPEFQ